jgi:EAL domain-containing protein (putative c-di-GMP-specific phosphodiesterase class I)
VSRLWQRILEPAGLTTVFQPIFVVSGARREVFALEALTRGPDATNIQRSDVLFEYVRRKRREAQVDRLAIASALRHASALPEVPGLCLNLHASTLEADRGFPQWLAEQAAEAGVPLHRILLEIVEHAPPGAGRQLRESLDRLRALGVRIALDDVGRGHSSFQMIVDCRPDLLKIDRDLVSGVYRDGYRWAVLQAIADLAQRIGCRAVAEGIEDEMDLDTALAAGIELAQGFYLCPPLPAARLGVLGLRCTAEDARPELAPCQGDDESPTEPIVLPI